jgi:hypothetical protein
MQDQITTKAQRRPGVRMGRPLLTIPDRDLDRVRAGELTIAGLARKLGVAPRTIRRRLRGSHWRVRAQDTQL